MTLDQAPTGTLTTSDTQLTFSSTDPTATFQCRLDAGSWADCTSPWQLTGLADGAHTAEVRATDPAGHTSEPVTATFTVAVPPTTTPPTTGPQATPIRLSTPRKVKATKKFTVRITGLARGQKITLRFGGKKITRTGTGQPLKIRLKAPRVKRTKKLKLKVTGALRTTRKITVKPRR